MEGSMGRTGVWLIGARGSVATTAIVGAAAVRAGAAAPTGCVAELPDFASAELPGLGELVFGGHDVVETPLTKRVEQLAHSGVIPAGDELGRGAGRPYAGRDGKTGETLLRSVLAPMFAQRGLNVLAWSGTNLLGGGDGATLADPGAASSKNASKQRVLQSNPGHE